MQMDPPITPNTFNKDIPSPQQPLSEKSKKRIIEAQIRSIAYPHYYRCRPGFENMGENTFVLP